MSIVDDIAGSKSTGGDNRIRDGVYDFTVKKILWEEKRSGPTFIAELQIVKSQDVSERDEHGAPVLANAPGTSASVVYVVSGSEDKKSVMKGNIKAFVLGLFGYADDQVTAEDFKKVFARVTGPEQAARGMLISGSTYRATSKAGKLLTLLKWASRKDQNTAELVQSRLAAIQ